MDDNKTLESVIKDQAGELETMKVLQLKLARTIDESNSGRDIAALSRQLREVTAKITELEAQSSRSDTVLDQVLAKHKNHCVRNENRQAIYEER